MAATRYMSHFYLQDRLRSLKNNGVEVPTLQFSSYKPEYIETRGNTEIYSGGRDVHPGQVIDSHGNIVDLARLESQRRFPSLSSLTDNSPKPSLFDASKQDIFKPLFKKD